MRLGILSDIHGNIYALEKVLAQAKKLGVQALLILGDLTGYYYHTREVLEVLADWPVNGIIRGNHEDYLIKITEGILSRENILKKYGSSINIALEEISRDQLNYIKNLKETVNVKVDSMDIYLAHGSPWNHDEYIYPDADIETWQKFNSYRSDFVFLGHTHYPYIHIGKNIIVANPGSVGQSRIHGGIADWAILDTELHNYIPKQTKYDATKLKEEVVMRDPHLPYLHTILER
jgi:putative phosphoesterase